MSRICAELHCHTLHSDALFTPEELAEAARDNQIDLIALTDHNTLSGYAQMEQTGLPFIHGIEWTTFYGHMLVLGARAFVDWRDAEMDNIDEKIAQVRAQDGLVGIAHPFAPGSPMCTGCYWDFRVRDWSRVNYIEVWNEDFPPLAPHNRRAVALWCSLLDQGYHIAPTYGRDWHRETFSPVPRGCTYLEAEAADEASALSAIAGGRTLLSLGPDVRWSLLGEDGIYAPGDTAKSGAYACRFEIDGERRRSRKGACSPGRLRRLERWTSDWRTHPSCAWKSGARPVGGRACWRCPLRCMSRRKKGDPGGKRTKLSKNI